MRRGHSYLTIASSYRNTYRHLNTSDPIIFSINIEVTQREWYAFVFITTLFALIFVQLLNNYSILLLLLTNLSARLIRTENNLVLNYLE